MNLDNSEKIEDQVKIGQKLFADYIIVGRLDFLVLEKIEKKHLDKISILLKKSEVKNIKANSFKRYGSARKLYNFNIDNVSSY